MLILIYGIYLFIYLFTYLGLESSSVVKKDMADKEFQKRYPFGGALEDLPKT